MGPLLASQVEPLLFAVHFFPLPSRAEQRSLTSIMGLHGNVHALSCTLAKKTSFQSLTFRMFPNVLPKLRLRNFCLTS